MEVLNEFQNQWLSESGPYFTGFSDFATRRVPKEEGKPPPQPCLASSECFGYGPISQNHLGPGEYLAVNVVSG